MTDNVDKPKTEIPPEFLGAPAIAFEVLPYRDTWEQPGPRDPMIRQVRVLKTNHPRKPNAWGIFSDDDRSNLGKDGYWIYSPQPSSRDDDFYEQYRWQTAHEAIRFAQNHLAKYPSGYQPFEKED